MEGEEGGGIRLSKRFSNNDKGEGEVDYKTKSGTAWSHSYLNQKPWHPLSYPNQRRKWIAEQTHAHRQRRAEEVTREYAQEQDFFRQTALISKKDKEKVELMQAVSFMYVRPPGYNAESAKAAEMADEKRKEELCKGTQEPCDGGGPSSSTPPSSLPGKDHLGEEKKKPRPKDVFGRPLPTEEEFEVLKNAPRLETGVPARVKPFGVEVRNVKCLRCGNYGHQSGDRECPLKDAIMPSEESRLKRDDPLNAILAHTDLTEPLKWELKQKPGISPPRGGFKPDDPNQQIVAEEDIFDEYGGFLGMDNIPDLLTNFSKKPKISKKSKRKKQQLNSESEASSDDGENNSKKKKVKVNKKKQDHAKSSSSSDTSDFQKVRGKSTHKSSYSSEDSDGGRVDRSRKAKHERSFLPKGSDHPRGRSKHDRQRHPFSSEGSDPDGYHGNYNNSDKHSYSSEDSDSDRDDQSRKNIQKHKRKCSRKRHSYSSEDSKNSEKHSYPSEESDSDRDDRSRKNIRKHKKKHSRKRHSYSSEDSGPAGHHRNHKNRDEHSYLPDDSNHQRQPKVKRSSHKHSSTAGWDSQKHNRNYDLDRYHGDQKSRSKHYYSSEDSDVDKDDQSRKIKHKDRYIPEGSEHSGRHMSKQSRKKYCYSYNDSGADGYHRSEKSRYEHSYSSESDNSDRHQRHLRRRSHKH